MKIWAADGEAGLMLGNGQGYRKIGPAGEALCAWDGCVYCAGGQKCHCYEDEKGEMRFDLSIPTGVCGLIPLGDSICALSSDADCLLAFCPRTGEMRFSAPAGNYPRDLCKSPCGRFLAVAGGAAGEILIFDESLACLEKYRVPGAACGVCFLPRGLMALCAVGEGELSSRLMRISPRGVGEEICALSDIPCSLCALPGGGCLAGCSDQVIRLRHDGKITFRLPAVYPARIRHFRGQSLICDLCQGEIVTLEGRAIYRGKAPLDVLAQ